MSASSTLRLVRNDIADPAIDAHCDPPPPLTPIVERADAALDALQGEIDALRSEINMLRRRDETINFHMLRLDEEMRLAARLQQDFLPRALPQVGSVHFHTLFRPAGYVSGDLYDVMRLDETHVAFYMCDAVGHGMPAALLTMFIKQALRTKQITPDGYRLLRPAETMAVLNEALVSQNLSQATFATAIYGLIDTQTLRMTFARGGHPEPLLFDRNGRLHVLEVEGSLLGIFPDEQFDETTVDLAAGDRLMIHTDGVEVAYSEDQTLDTQRWRQELQKRAHLSAEELIGDFSKHIDHECGSLTPKDDLTMIIAEVR